MRFELINKGSFEFILVISAGFAQSPKVFSSLVDKNVALAVCYDWRESDDFSNDFLENYEKIGLLAWSLGVKMAGLPLSGFEDKLSYAIAYNGTIEGVCKGRGINPRSYDLTLQHFNEQTFFKFLEKMCESKVSFETYLKLRGPFFPLETYKEELIFLKESKSVPLNFDEAVIGLEDSIFPPLYQQASWENCGKTPVITQIPHSFHYDPTALPTMCAKILSKTIGKN